LNGYETFASTSAVTTSQATTGGFQQVGNSSADFKIGEMKFPDIAIGDIKAPVSNIAQAQQPITPPAEVKPQQEIRRIEARNKAEELRQALEANEKKAAPLLRIARSQMYKVMGDDQKVYGPVLGREIERWINEGRIDMNTLAQKVGFKNWKRLADFAEEMEHASTPPEIPSQESGR